MAVFGIAVVGTLTFADTVAVVGTADVGTVVVVGTLTVADTVAVVGTAVVGTVVVVRTVAVERAPLF